LTDLSVIELVKDDIENDVMKIDMLLFTENETKK